MGAGRMERQQERRAVIRSCGEGLQKRRRDTDKEDCEQKKGTNGENECWFGEYWKKNDSGIKERERERTDVLSCCFTGRWSRQQRIA